MRLLILSCLLFALVGCHGDDGPLDFGLPDGGPPGASMTRFYVIDTLQFPTADDTGTVIDGFDLDGTSATVCGQPDYSAPESRGGLPGVDDVSSYFFGIANTQVQSDIDLGRLLLLLEVDDIDDFRDDPSVGVHFHLARLRPGATVPVHRGHCYVEPSDPSWDPTCRVAPGQTFDVYGDPFDFRAASIVSGHLVASMGNFPLIPAAALVGARVPVAIHAARLDFEISAGALSRGVVGGAVDDSEFLAAVGADPTVCSYVGTFAPIIAALSDLAPTALGPCMPGASDGGVDAGAAVCPSGSSCDSATATCMSCSQMSIAVDMTGVFAYVGDVVAAPSADAGPSCLRDAGPD